MKTTFVRILAGNLGDGWKNQDEAAQAYADWIDREKGVRSEVQCRTCGVGGGTFDENGDETPDNGQWWEEFCSSEEAKKYWS